jgi:hypothetical protein
MKKYKAMIYDLEHCVIRHFPHRLTWSDDSIYGEGQVSSGGLWSQFFLVKSFWKTKNMALIVFNSENKDIRWFYGHCNELKPVFDAAYLFE